jgi:hypothetical protein
MPTYLLCHRHEPGECAVAFAAWRGFDSPLRHTPTLASCLHGGHEVWWTVEARDAASALTQLPAFLAERCRAVPVREVTVP